MLSIIPYCVLQIDPYCQTPDLTNFPSLASGFQLKEPNLIIEKVPCGYWNSIYRDKFDHHPLLIQCYLHKGNNNQSDAALRTSFEWMEQNRVVDVNQSYSGNFFQLSLKRLFALKFAELYRDSFQGRPKVCYTSRVCCISWEMLFMLEWACLPVSV